MTGEAISETERARAELAAALSELEEKLNIPKRVRRRVAELRENSPLAVAGIVIGGAIAVGGLVWLAARPHRR